jgi:hypothetical protein
MIAKFSGSPVYGKEVLRVTLPVAQQTAPLPFDSALPNLRMSHPERQFTTGKRKARS